MKTWLRLLLVTMTVGGGFTRVILSSQLIFSPQAQNAGYLIIMLIFILLYLFILVSGLIFVQNPNRTGLLFVSLGIQIPVIHSPIISYQLTSGFSFIPGVGSNGLSFDLRFGNTFYLYFFKGPPWGVRLNFVALILLLFLVHHVKQQSIGESN
jgi:hypothetical protein